MKYLDTIRGTGILHIKTKPSVPVTYEIEVYEERPGGLKNSVGKITPVSGDMGDLYYAAGEKCILETEEGHKIEVISDIGGDIHISGDVPGYEE